MVSNLDTIPCRCFGRIFGAGQIRRGHGAPGPGPSRMPAPALLVIDGAYRRRDHTEPTSGGAEGPLALSPQQCGAWIEGAAAPFERYRTKPLKKLKIPTYKSFTRFFSKNRGVQGQSPGRPSQRAKYPRRARRETLARRSGRNTPSVPKRHPQMAQSPAKGHGPRRHPRGVDGVDHPPSPYRVPSTHAPGQMRPGGRCNSS